MRVRLPSKKLTGGGRCSSPHCLTEFAGSAGGIRDAFHGDVGVIEFCLGEGYGRDGAELRPPIETLLESEAAPLEAAAFAPVGFEDRGEEAEESDWDLAPAMSWWE